jgi:hypothetical protein
MGVKTWCVTLREEETVFQDRVLRRIFELRKKELTGGWRKLRNGFHNLYCSGNIITVLKLRKVRWVGHVARMGEMRYAYKILIGKPEGKIFGRSKCKWDNNIRTNLEESWCGLDPYVSKQDPVVDSIW